MLISSLSYQDPYWELDHLELGKLNLIVAPNGTGKSKTLATIDLLFHILTQRRDLNWGGKWEVKFVADDNKKIGLNFATRYMNGGVVTAEKVELDGLQVLFRFKNGEPRVELRNQMERINDTVYPPANKLTLHVNRDVRKYPYLEHIASWAENSFGFKFGNISPYTKLTEQEYALMTAIEDIPALFNQLTPESRANVMEQFNGLGYQITEITTQTRGETILYIHEQGLQKPIPHFRISQGMFRSLALIIYLEYLTCRKKPVTVLIDDLCEGLDYNRATKLGKLVFDICERGNIQLIATSNDTHLMDVIDIEHWNILRRTDKKVSAISVHSHPDLFEDFRFTGLSNADFFASDFIAQHEL